MKANELRIGNLINHRGQTKEVNALVISSIENGLFKEDYFKPIPLTEEWLLKFGFETYYDDEDMTKQQCLILDSNMSQLVLESYLTLIEPPLMVSLVFDESDPIQNVYYVHQLQNLYFALTGEELNGTS